MASDPARSYGALEEEQCCAWPRAWPVRGLETGERLFIRMGNSLDYALVFFAANAAGAVPIPASPMLTAPEVDRLRRLCGARFMAWDGALALPDLEGVRLLAPGRCRPAEKGPCRPVCRYGGG